MCGPHYPPASRNVVLLLQRNSSFAGQSHRALYKRRAAFPRFCMTELRPGTMRFATNSLGAVALVARRVPCPAPGTTWGDLGALMVIDAEHVAQGL